MKLRRLATPAKGPTLRHLLHTSTALEATPLHHPTFPGPPPSAPQASVTFAADRLARKKQQQAELLRQAQQARADASSQPSTSPLQKRFWRNVSVSESAEGLQILLDSRPVRTARRQVLTLPKHKRALATAIALEWDHLLSAQQALKQHYVPLTSLTARAVDLQAADAQRNPKLRDDLVRMAMRYLGTDTLLCWAPTTNVHDPNGRMPDGRTLRERQREVAEPVIAFLKTHIFPGVEIRPILSEDSIVPAAQPELTREVIRGWVAGLPAFELAALERGVLASKSLLIAARLLVEWSREFGHLRRDGEEERFGIDRAAEAASLEVAYQTAQWGEVDDTHDVDREDLRRQLGSLILLVS